MDTPAQALDRELKVALARFQRMRWMLVGVIGVIVVVAIAVGAVLLVRQSGQLNRDQAQLQTDNARLLASCDFYRPLTSLPVTVNPATGKPAEISVAVIAAAREAYAGQGCAGRMPAADSSLVRWAAYYHIPLRQ